MRRSDPIGPSAANGRVFIGFALQARGIIVAIQDELGIPTRFVGTGEQLDDFASFDRRVYLDNLL